MTDPNLTHIALVVDRSWSMMTLAESLNPAIKALLKDQDAEPGKLRVDVTTFDTKVETPYMDAKATEVIEGKDLIMPRGDTALNDAIAKTIQVLGERFADRDEKARPGHVIVVIVTDGEENSSVEFRGIEGRDKVKALIERQKADYNWEFIFMGADSIDAFSAAAGYGVGRGQTMSFASTQAGAENMVFASSAYITRSRNDEEDNTFSDDEREAAKEK